jgi:hypothetical protein
MRLSRRSFLGWLGGVLAAATGARASIPPKTALESQWEDTYTWDNGKPTLVATNRNYFRLRRPFTDVELKRINEAGFMLDTSSSNWHWLNERLRR